MNQLTHWLDTSQVYGSSEFEQLELREMAGGRLVSSFQGDLLPANRRTRNCRGRCFRSGDGRVDENTFLSVLHVVFHREHNRVAGELGRRNGHWDDETLFQEAR